MIKRLVNLPEKLSFFLFGPRQTGKSTLIDSLYNENIWKINLLFSDVFLIYSRNPALLRKEAEEKILHKSINQIFIDEIQRVPELLNEVHYLIEKYPQCQFILTGSSARKLKRTGVNLLAGRAVERFLFPFVYEEVKETFDLNEALLLGTLPPLMGKARTEKIDILHTYTHTYLQEEIKNEGIVRNIGGFSRFLEVAAAQFGELVNYSAISRECALPIRTVQGYYEILEDTLIGMRLEPWRKSLRKRLSGHPKFYLFDNGVTNAINHRLSDMPDSILKGRLFEQFIVLETKRKLSYAQSEAEIFFWRTNHGAEVDLLLAKHNEIIAAIEIKSASQIDSANLSGLRAFKQENPQVPCMVVCAAANSYEINGIKIIPWQEYLKNFKIYFPKT